MRHSLAIDDYRDTASTIERSTDNPNAAACSKAPLRHPARAAAPAQQNVEDRGSQDLRPRPCFLCHTCHRLMRATAPRRAPCATTGPSGHFDMIRQLPASYTMSKCCSRKLEATAGPPGTLPAPAQASSKLPRNGALPGTAEARLAYADPPLRDR